MHIKKEYIILIAIISALAVYLILRDPNRTLYQLPKIAKISRTDISKIEISNKDATIQLNKKEDKWRLGPEGYLANTDRVNNMLDIIEGFAVTALVSESKNYTRYDLDDGNKITVKAWTGDRLERDFDVGKASESRRLTFVKLANDDRVYHARGNFRDQFDQTVDRLRDKTVLLFDQNEIEEIRIAKGQQDIVFVRTGAPTDVSADQMAEDEHRPPPQAKTIWQTPDGREGNETELNRLLTALSNLRCQEYIDDAKKEDFSNPLCAVQLKGVQEYSLSLFGKKDKDAKSYPAVSSASDYPFLIPEWQADGLLKEYSEMLKEGSPSKDAIHPIK